MWKLPDLVRARGMLAPDRPDARTFQIRWNMLFPNRRLPEDGIEGPLTADARLDFERLRARANLPVPEQQYDAELRAHLSRSTNLRWIVAVEGSIQLGARVMHVIWYTNRSCWLIRLETPHVLVCWQTLRGVANDGFFCNGMEEDAWFRVDH